MDPGIWILLLLVFAAPLWRFWKKAEIDHLRSIREEDGERFMLPDQLGKLRKAENEEVLQHLDRLRVLCGSEFLSTEQNEMLKEAR